MGNHINWDVCPEWVTFKRKPIKIQERPLEENILFEEKDEVIKHPQNNDSMTSEAIALPQGNHYHRICIKDGPHIIEKKTGPAIRVGRRQHFHFIQ